MGEPVDALVHAFNVGEVTTAALARIDQERIRLAAEVQENLLPHTIGKAMVRPGFEYIATMPGQGRLIKFVKSVSDVAQLVLVDAELRVLVNDAFVTRPSVTSTVSDGTFSSAATDRALGSTVTVSSTAAGAAANIIDSDPATVWVSNGTATATVTFDLTTARTIYHIWIMGDSNSSSTIQRAPTSFTVLGSNTGAFGGEEVTLLTVSGAANWTQGEERTYTLTTTGSYRYYRISMTANELGSGSYRLASVSLWDTAWRFKRVGYATLDIASGALVLSAPYRGGYAVASQQVSTSSSGVEHALNVTVSNGPVLFRVGSTDGDDDLVTSTELATGVYSLSFTPAGSSYWIEFSTDLDRGITIDSCTVASSGVMTLTAPWATAELNQIQYNQSKDDVWLTHENWRTRIVQRRASTSWGIAQYIPEDGPFTVSRTAPVELTPSATRGYGVTLSASRPFFKSTHVGALFKLTHERFNATFNIAGPGTYTDIWRVAGIATSSGSSDRNWTATTTGSWGGSLRDQRSSTDPGEIGFTDYRRETGAATITWTGNATFSNQDNDDNLITWHRVGFIPGQWSFGYATQQITYDGYGGYGICRVTSVTNSTTAVVEVLTPFKNIVATSDWQEGEWSARRGYPTAAQLFDGRHWVGDAAAKFAGSVSNNLYSFDETVEGASGSIQRSIETGSPNSRVNAFLPLQRLLMLTDAAEVSARSSSFDAPLTPDDLTLKDASNWGSARISPVKSGSRGYFVGRSLTSLYRIAYDVESNDYTSRTLMRYNDEIGLPGIVMIDYQHHPEPYIWAVLSNGRCICLLDNPAEEVSCWFKVISEGDGNGDIESISVLPGATEDRVYVIVERTLNGSTVRTIEKMALRSEAEGATATKIADSFETAAGPVSSITAAHLANTTGLVGWGVTSPGGVKTVLTGLSANGSGVIALGATYTSICVGLPYSWRYQSSKLAYGAQDGTALLRPKRVDRLGLNLQRFFPGALTYGAAFDRLYPMPGIEGSAAVSTTTIDTYDERTLAFDGTWDTDSRVCLAGAAPYPCTLLALVVAVETE